MQKRRLSAAKANLVLPKLQILNYHPFLAHLLQHQTAWWYISVKLLDFQFFD